MPLAPRRGVDLTERNLSWFAERVERGKREIFVEIVTITPEIAKRLLEQNECNRPVSESLVAQITKDISCGYWVLNGETIIVSAEGFLNDGQHRLLAVVRADAPIQTAMMFGVSRGSRTTVDQGRSRSTANFMSMTNVPNAHRASAVANLWLAYTKGILRPENTRQDVLAFYRQHKREIDGAVHRLGVNPYAVSVGYAPLVASFLILKEVNPTDTEWFFDKFLSGADLSQESPILWLRQKMSLIHGDAVRNWLKLELILRHWNAWRAKKQMTRHIAFTGQYPDVLP
jgi:hypothetical protein